MSAYNLGVLSGSGLGSIRSTLSSVAAVRAATVASVVCMTLTCRMATPVPVPVGVPGNSTDCAVHVDGPSNGKAADPSNHGRLAGNAVDTHSATVGTGAAASTASDALPSCKDSDWTEYSGEDVGDAVCDGELDGMVDEL